MTSITEILDRLNAWQDEHGTDPERDIWQEVILQLDAYDEHLIDVLEGSDASDRFLTRGGTIIRHAAETGQWVVTGHADVRNVEFALRAEHAEFLTRPRSDLAGNGLAERTADGVRISDLSNLAGLYGPDDDGCISIDLDGNVHMWIGGQAYPTRTVVNL